MLRASKRVTIDTNVLQAHNGFILAPIIDLQGLVLRADYPVPEPIKCFLTTKNVNVGRVRVNYKDTKLPEDPDCYEYYVRIYGTFSISKREVTDFITNNAALMETQLRHIDDMPAAIKMQSCIEEQYKLCEEDATYADLAHNLVWEVPVSGMFTNETNINTKKMSSSQPIMGKDSVDINTVELVSKGNVLVVKEKEINAGLMAPLFGLKKTNINFAKKAQFEDTLISGENISIKYTGDENENGDLTLGMNTNIDWLNNPYHDFFRMFPVKSNIERYELKKEQDETGKKHATIVKVKPRPS
jgi:hypothetical protein